MATKKKYTLTLKDAKAKLERIVVKINDMKGTAMLPHQYAMCINAITSIATMEMTLEESDNAALK